METVLDPVELTRKLISFNTINPPGYEQPCAEFLGQMLESEGFTVATYEFDRHRTSLVARMGEEGNKAPLCFTGHMDTVPLGGAQWSKDPLGAEIDGDKLYGRGASDMKSGLAAMVVAAVRLAREFEGGPGITMAITAGEETGSRGAEHLVQLGHALGSAGAVVVGEPTANYPMLGHKGALWIEAWTTGVTAHGSMPDQGDNAIYKAARAVTRLQEFNFDLPPHPFLGMPTLNVGTFSGGMNINSVPDRAGFEIDVRTIPSVSTTEIYARLKTVMGPEVHCRKRIDLGCVASDPQAEWIQTVYRIMAPVVKERPQPKGAAYFTDASFLTPAFGHPPTIILGPGESTMAHKTDEYCHISKIEAVTEAYLEIGRNWCRV